METLRSATIMMAAISSRASALPASMLLMLRSEMYENITEAPVGSARMYSGTLSSSQSPLLCSSSRIRTVESSPTLAVMRVADLSTLMRSLRSSP